MDQGMIVRKNVLSNFSGFMERLKTTVEKATCKPKSKWKLYPRISV